MNFTKSFTYIFEDPDWFSKLILPMLCSLIPFVGPLVMAGYIIHLIHNVAVREPKPLPQLNFGEDLARGFKWFVVMLIYVIPLILLIVLMVVPVSASNEKAPAVAIIVSIFFGGITLAYIVFLWLLMPLAQAHFAVNGTISSGLAVAKFAKMFSRNVAEWLLVLAGGLLAGLISPIGGIFFFIGALITGTYASLMVSHLTGQAYAISTLGGPYSTNAVVYAPQPPYNQAYKTQSYQPVANQESSYMPVDDHQPYNVVSPTPQIPFVEPWHEPPFTPSEPPLDEELRNP
jgi:hypothetical protein